MSLKSSEINDYSWIISAVLKSPFCSSSCCQACFPSIVRPISCLWKLTLKMFFILQNWTAPSSSRCPVWEYRRRWITFLETSYAEREEFPGSISIHFLSFIGMMFGESTSSLLCDFAFAFDRHAKSFIFSCDACSSGRSSGTSVLLLFESITNLFDPWEILIKYWVLSSLRDQILIPTPCLPYRQLVVTSKTGPIFVFHWIHCDDPSLLGRVYSRHAFV